MLCLSDCLAGWDNCSLQWKSRICDWTSSCLGNQNGRISFLTWSFRLDILSNHDIKLYCFCTVLMLILNNCLHWDCEKYQSQRHPVCTPQHGEPGLSRGPTSAFTHPVWCRLCVWLHIKVRHDHTPISFYRYVSYWSVSFLQSKGTCQLLPCLANDVKCSERITSRVCSFLWKFPIRVPFRLAANQEQLQSCGKKKTNKIRKTL